MTFLVSTQFRLTGFVYIDYVKEPSNHRTGSQTFNIMTRVYVAVTTHYFS